MTRTVTATTPGEAALQFWPLTVTHFVLIGIGVVAALMLIWWGAKLLRRRRAAMETLAARDELAPPAPPEAAPTKVASPSPAPIATVAEPDPIAAPPTPAPPAGPEPEPSLAGPEASDPGSAGVAPDGSVEPSVMADMTPPPADAADRAAPAAPPADDLTVMKGVGPRLAERLASLGITRFDQIAGLGPDDAAELDARLGDFRGRIERDRWIEQARLLAAGDREGFEAAFGRLG